MLRCAAIQYSFINKSNRFLAQHNNIYVNHRLTSSLYDENKRTEQRQRSIQVSNELNKFKKIVYFKEHVVEFYQKLVGFNEMEIFHTGIIKTQV